MGLVIKIQSDEMTRLGLRGRLDATGVGEVELRFTSQTVPRSKPLLVDISEVTSIAPLGLRMLLTVAKALDGRGVKTVFLRPQPAVGEVLKISGFDQLIPVYNDEGEAAAFLAGGESRCS
jgi:anti-anti-sigma factor